MWTPEDTEESAWRAQHDVWRRMGGEGRLRAAFAASEQVRRVAEAGIRSRHPDLSDEQVRMSLYRLLLGDKLFDRAYPEAASSIV